MVLRKPYAFLIKYFKLIHLAMFIMMSFVLYKIVLLRSFLDRYIASGRKLNTLDDLPSKYAGFLFIFTILFVIFLSFVIFYLLKYKKKPYKFYIVIIISNVLLFFFLLYTRSFIYGLNFSTPDLRFTRIVRDVYTIEMFIQIILVIFILVRAVGFDIRKFDFKKDLIEFNVSSEDNEEFEFGVDLDKDDIAAIFRKFKRNFKSYYKENKIVFLVTSVIILIVPTILVVRAITSIEKVYKENEVFNVGPLSISVLDSYKTTVNFKGEEINNTKYYVILKMRYKNNSSNNYQLPTDYARLSYDDYNNVSPTTYFYDNFSEYGVPYYSQILHGWETRDFIFVYELDREFFDNSLYLKFLYDIRYVNKEVKYYYNVTKLSPKVDSKETVEMDTKNKGEELVFSDSVLGNTKITINDYSIADRFQYGLLKCTVTGCDKNTNFLQVRTSASKVYTLTLMRLDYNLVYDSALGDYKIDKFIEKYGSIRFVVNGKEHVNKTTLTDVTPYKTSNRYAFIEVSNNLKKAEKIYLDFTIRDKKYTYVIKDDSKENKQINNEIIEIQSE